MTSAVLVEDLVGDVRSTNAFGAFTDVEATLSDFDVLGSSLTNKRIIQ